MLLDPHALAEARSIEMHRAVVERLRSDPSSWVQIRERLDRWLAQKRPYAAAWAELLAGSPEQLFAFMVDPGERARELRQSTPFAGVLDPRTRWRIHEEVRQRLERQR